MDNFRRKVVVSLFSSYASQLVTTAANLATKILLARLIAPDDLGLYSLALVTMLAGDMLVDLGVSQHMIREEHRPYGNFLALKLIIASVLFIGIQLGAPYVKFWGSEFPLVIRAMAVTLVIKAASGVPTVFIDRELIIQKSLLPQFARILSMGLVSIGFAFFHYGVWALVWGTIAAEAAYAVLIWKAAIGRMPLELTWKFTRSLVWGSKFLFLIGIMGFALSQGDIAILGALLTPKQVGLYAMAYTLVILVSKVVESAVFRVIYPTFCEYSQDLRTLGRTYRLATLAITAIEAPIYFFLLFNAPIVVPWVLGHKWDQAAVLMQALAVFGIINPFSTFGNEVLRARKRDAVLTLSTVIGAVTLMTTGYFLTSRFGTLGIVAAHYLIIGSIPTVVTVYRTLKADFIKLAGQLAVVYVTSLALIATVSVGLSSIPWLQALAAGLLIPACWYGYYRTFGNGVGRDMLTALSAPEAAG